MNCSACGAQNASDARFCNMCGARVAVDTPVSSPSAARASPAMSASAMSTGSLRGAPDAMGSTQSVSLTAIGVQSSGRTYAVIGIAATALICAGAAGMWFFTRSSAPPVVADALPPPPANSPIVIGTPLPTGEEPPAVDFVTGSRRHAVKASTGSGSTPRTPATGTGSTPRAGTTTAARPTPHAATGTTSRGGTTTARAPTNGRTGGGTAGADTPGTGETSGTGTGTGPATGAAGDPPPGGGDPPPAGGTAGTDTIPADVGDERDIAAELYAGQVRRVIRQFYSARAQACFEHASRNQEVRGTVVIAFTIPPDGQVTRASVERNTTGDEALGRCLAGQVGSWRLPAPGAEAVAMSIPFSR